MSSKKLQSKEIIGLLIFAIGLLFILSLTSYSPKDPPWATVFPAHAHVLNKCGYVGSVISAAFFRLLGVTPAYVLVFTLAAWGLLMFFNRQPSSPGLKIGAWLFFILALAGMEALLFSPNAFTGRAAGGMLGVFLGEHIFEANFNFAGAVLISTVIALVAFLVATDFSLMKLPALAGGLVARFSTAGSAVAEKPARKKKKKKRPEPVAAEENVEETVEEEEADDEEIARMEARNKRLDALLKRKEIEAKKMAEKRDKEETDRKKRLEAEARKAKRTEGYELPPLELLDPPHASDLTGEENVMRRDTDILEKTLKDFNVEAGVVDIERGPVVTMYEMKLAPGIKVSKVSGLSNELAMALKAEAVRIVAPIPGKDTVGIEVPNRNRDLVCLRELIEKATPKTKNQEIPLFLGKNTKGNAIISNMAKLPHLLIAGETGSGKSVCISSLILSIIYTKKPDEVKLILIDPKKVELSFYQDIPHLMHPVVTDPKKAQAVLEWAVKKMEDRYQLLKYAGVNHMSKYNDLPDQEKENRVRPQVEADFIVPKQLPYVVIVIDELADLMMVAQKEIETAITRLAQKSRAVGIHLILATQRPSVDVITGLIKSNMPSRIAFRVLTGIDSNTILGKRGAEKLLGMGDMLYSSPGMRHLVRAQGTFVSDQEIIKTTGFIKGQAEPEFNEELAKWKPSNEKPDASPDGVDEGAVPFGEPAFMEAVEVFLQEGRASTTLLQTRLKIGYAHAARLVDQMAQVGIVGPSLGAKGRELLVTPEEWEEMKNSLLSGEGEAREESEDEENETDE